MPLAPGRACPCGGIIRQGTCDRCGPKHRTQHTQTSGQRGYDYAWQKFRINYLREHPLCSDCESEGIVTAATELHHLTKIKHAPHKRLDRDNVLGLCDMHHNQRTARGE